MSAKPAVPVVIGVGDVKNRSTKVEDALEPLELITQAIVKASIDTELSQEAATSLLSQLDSISIVRTWTWPYRDLPGSVASGLGATPSHKYYSEHGGNSSAKIFDEAARRISQRKSKVAVVTGGEALASLNACAAAGKLPPSGWEKVEEDVKSVFSPTTRQLGTDLGATHSIGAPIQVYPLYENAFRAHHAQSIQENNMESAELYGHFSQVASHHEYAWNQGKPADTAESIGTVTKKNRMICFPYPLLMNAFNTVNLAAACILTSTEHARELGIPENRWIYPLGGAGTKDSAEFWHRPNFYTSPSISQSLDAATEISGLKREDIDLYDFYSCFPIVPKLACRHLGLSITKPEKPITLLGGLTSFGGAGNNYSMHALTEMVRQLRQGRGKNGVVLANGGVATYQHVVVLSSKPRSSPYPAANPLPEMVTGVPCPGVDLQAEGEATIETYTVDFNRDGSPLCGHIVGRLKSSGHRFIANHADDATLRQLTSASAEPIGKTGWVMSDGEGKGRNVFSFDNRASL